ncbi:hypothetical protein GCM10007937_47400 [Mesorhizobium albiziae]|nr:hypothetical protein GCM10007937_47400 [Mesorhizobium albiziae]
MGSNDFDPCKSTTAFLFNGGNDLSIGDAHEDHPESKNNERLFVTYNMRMASVNTLTRRIDVSRSW